MIELILLAIGSGLVLSFGFGSVFFALVQTSIDHGFAAGRNLAWGVAISDVLLIAIAILGTGFLPDIPHMDTYAGLVGATLLFGLGFSQFRPTAAVPEGSIQLTPKAYMPIAKGFVLNVVNPVNFLAWVVVSTALKSYKYLFFEELLFFLFCIATIFLTESAIAYFAFRIRERMSPKIILRIKYLTGVIFIGLGIKILWGNL